MADHASMRGANRSLVLGTIRVTGPTSRAELARATGLAKPTVSAIVDELLSDGTVFDLGPGDSGAEGGRPPDLLGFNARSGFVGGVHIGVHRTTVVLADALGHEIDRWSELTVHGDPELTLAAVTDAITALTDATPEAAGRLLGVGVCVPGLVETATGRCLLAPNLRWSNVDVAEVVQQRSGVPALVRNTAQMCALAEATEGAARGHGDMVLVYAGSGVGAGIVSDSGIFEGADGITGELGHCPVPGNERHCTCGRTGCLETVASGPAIAQALGVDVPPGRSAMDHVVALAADGDDGATVAMVRAASHLGWATAWMVNVLNPHAVILGGTLADAGPRVLESFSDAVRSHALEPSVDRVRIGPWQLGQSAKVRGAVLVALGAAEGRLSSTSR